MVLDWLFGSNDGRSRVVKALPFIGKFVNSDAVVQAEMATSLYSGYKYIYIYIETAFTGNALNEFW